MPQLSQIHIDVALTNMSVMYRNPVYIADEVLAPVNVAKRSDKYFTYQKTDFLSPSVIANGRPASTRRPGTEAAEIDYSVSTQSYYCEEMALRGIVTDAEVAIADNPLQPDADQAVQNMERLLLDNENMVATVVGNRNNYPSANKATLTTGSTGTSWASYTSANSNPLGNFRDAKIQVIKQIVREANRCVVTVDGARYLAQHPAIKDLTKYTSKESLTNSGMPAVIIGLEMIEGATQMNNISTTAGESATYSGANVWQDSSSKAEALVFYYNPTPTLKSVAFGYTFEAPDDATGVRGYSVRRWREDRRKGSMIETSTLRDWRFVATDGSTNGQWSAGLAVGGYLLSDIIS